MLVAENPNMVSKIVIGQSYEGRPLNVLKVSQTNDDSDYIKQTLFIKDSRIKISGFFMLQLILPERGEKTMIRKHIA